MIKFLVAVFCLSFLAAFATAQTYNLSHSLVYGSALTNLTAGQLSSFYIQLRDTSNTNVTTCPVINPFNVTLAGPQTPNRTLPSSCSNGRYQINFRNIIAGYYNLTINPLVNATYTPLTSPASIYALNVVVAGVFTGFKGIVGQRYAFNVTPYDTYNNRIYTCGPLNVWSVSVLGAVNGQGSVSTCDSSTGIYYGSFVATNSGGYDMVVTVANQGIKGSPFHINLNPGPVYPPNCVYQGKSPVYAGDLTVFTVQSYDRYVNTITVCDSNLVWNSSLQLNGQDVAPVNYVGCAAGVYTLNYTMTKANPNYDIDVTINNTDIMNGPFAVQVLAAKQISPAQTTATGVGLVNATAGVPASLIIKPSDKYGNPNPRCDANWADFTLDLTDPMNTSVVCSGQVVGCNNTNGYYTAQWSCYVATVYDLVIEYQFLPIGNSPFAPTVQPASLNARTTPAYGPGIYSASAGVPSLVFLNPFDEYENQIKSCDLATFDPALLNIQVYDSTDNVMGQFVSCVPGPNGANITLTYNITSIALTDLAITYNGEPIENSYFTLTTYPGPPDAGHCFANGTGLSYANAGEYGEFTVQCSDRFGNVISACLPLDNWYYDLTAPTLSNRTGAPYQCTNTTTDVPSTTYFRYNQTQSGLYNLVFGYDNNNLNPYMVTIIPGPFDAPNSLAIGDGVYSQSIRAGDRVNFLILARDRFGNNVTNCLDHTLIGINPKPPLQPTGATFQILPCNQTQNVTTVQYSSTLASMYQIDITYAGAEIQDSPYHPRIIAGPIDYSTIVATGPGLVQATAGVPAQITLKANDQYNNPINYCDNSASNFSLNLVNVNRTSVHVNGYVYGCNIGVYQANYTATVSGRYNLSIQYATNDIPKSPFAPLVYPGPSNDSQAVVYVMQDQTVAGTFGLLYVVARDSYQNNISSCVPPLSYTAYFTGVRAGVTFHQTDMSSDCLDSTQPGTWVIPFNLTQATTWSVNVFGTMYNVSNSPVAVTVVHAAIFAPNSRLDDFNSSTVLVVGQQVPYTLTVADLFKNNITDCSDPNISHWNVYTLALDKSRSYTGSIQCANGLYQGTYSALRPGLYSLTIQYNGSNLRGSPYAPLNFTYGYPSTDSNATGPGVYSQNLVAGEQTWFKINTYNQYKVPIEACPPAPFTARNWTVSFDEPYRFDSTNATVMVGNCDEADGSFTGYYTPTKARLYAVTIQLDGKDIQDDPYTPRVIPAAIDPYMTIVSGLNGTGDNGTIILQTRDQFGNYETSVNKSLFNVTLSPRCASSVVTTESNGGLILAHYEVSEGGIYCPSIAYESYIVPLPNATIHAIGGHACNDSCNYKGYCFKNQAPSTATSDFSCSCFQGWTGDLCSDKMSSKYPLAIGAVVGLIVGLAVLLFIIGLILGFFVFKFLGRRGGAEIEPLI